MARQAARAERDQQGPGDGILRRAGGVPRLFGDEHPSSDLGPHGGPQRLRPQLLARMRHQRPAHRGPRPLRAGYGKDPRQPRPFAGHEPCGSGHHAHRRRGTLSSAGGGRLLLPAAHHPLLSGKVGLPRDGQGQRQRGLGISVQPARSVRRDGALRDRRDPAGHLGYRDAGHGRAQPHRAYPQ